MPLHNQLPVLTHDEFVTFLLIYAGHVDLKLSEEEIKIIEASTSPSMFFRMKELFENVSDYRALEIIIAHKDKYCKTEEDLNAVLGKTMKLFKSDGEYSSLEIVLQDFLRRILR